MQVARVIPCLDVTGGRVVKGTNFVDLRDAGDPVELAARYDAEGADELVFLDITASSDDRDTTVDMVYRVAEQVYIPFTVGGGIRIARGRPPHAPGRRRQGQRQHRRGPAPRADQRDRRRVRLAVRRVCDRRQAARRRCRRGVRGVPARWSHADRYRRDRVGEASGRARCRRDPAHVDGSRRHAGRLRPRAHAGDRRCRHRAGHRQRRCRHARPPRRRASSTGEPTPCSRRRSSTSASTPSPTPRPRWPPPASRSARPAERRGSGTLRSGGWAVAGVQPTFGRTECA